MTKEYSGKGIQWQRNTVTKEYSGKGIKWQRNTVAKEYVSAPPHFYLSVLEGTGMQKSIERAKKSLNNAEICFIRLSVSLLPKV